MNIPKLQRVSLKTDNLKHLNLSIPDNLVRYDFDYQFSTDELRLLKLGLIEDEVVYIEGDWLYYFARHQPYRFNYNFLLAENEEGTSVRELWADARLGEKFIYGGTTADTIKKAIRDISKRERPHHLGLYRKKPDLMQETQIHPMTDLELSKEQFYRLIWGHMPASMDDHWMTWFDFESQIFHIHWHWGRSHLYQVRFEETETGYKTLEVHIPIDNGFDPAHAKGRISYFASTYPYPIEEV